MDVYRRVGGLPEYTTLDDLPFGYRLTIDAIPVHVMPATTTVPAPEHVGELVAMHRRWFGNYLDYPACARHARAHGHGTRSAHTVALAVGGYRAATWALATPAALGCAAVLLRPGTRPSVRALAAAGLWLGCVAPVRLLAAADGRQMTFAEQLRESTEVFAAYVIKSVGPLTALASGNRGLLSAKTYRRLPPVVKETL